MNPDNLVALIGGTWVAMYVAVSVVREWRRGGSS